MVSPNFTIIFSGTCDTAGGRVLWENVVWLVWIPCLPFQLAWFWINLISLCRMMSYSSHLCDQDASCRRHGVPELYNLFWEPVTVLEGATHVRKCSLAGLVPLLTLQLARFWINLTSLICKMVSCSSLLRSWCLQQGMLSRNAVNNSHSLPLILDAVCLWLSGPPWMSEWKIKSAFSVLQGMFKLAYFGINLALHVFLAFCQWFFAGLCQLHIQR